MRRRLPRRASRSEGSHSRGDPALIRPDFPEPKVLPYFWRQTEYVRGGKTKYLFPVLAVNQLYKKGKGE